MLGILESEEEMVKYKRLELNKSTKLSDAVDQYLHSKPYAELSGTVQYKYERSLTRACDTSVQNGKQLGNIRLGDIMFKHITYAYDRWVEENGPSAANYTAAALSVVFNTAMRHEAMLANPVSLLRRKTTKPRKVKWERSQVTAFLDVAYSKWKYRSIGLIVHMAYEWGQRLGDMRLLEWDAIDFDNHRVDITQSKRGAEVHLPIPDDLLAMLKAQHEYFNFQKYVAPQPNPKGGHYPPYNELGIHDVVNRVKAEAGLPAELQARDLRRTAITEMVEAGVDAVGIMQVSGHQDIASIKPYLVNTFSGASAALAKRKGIKE